MFNIAAADAPLSSSILTMNRVDKQKLDIAVLYVGTSLLAPLRQAESEINRNYPFSIHVATHNCGAPLTVDQWDAAERDIANAEIVFLIHVTDSENAARIANALARANASATVIAFNCMPDLMRCTRIGKLDFHELMKSRGSQSKAETGSRGFITKVGAWMSDHVRGRRHSESETPKRKAGPPKAASYVGLISKMPRVLKYVPTSGRLRDIKNYLYLFAYFLQPTPANIRSMLLYAIKHYSSIDTAGIAVEVPETLPALGIYHPNSQKIFDTLDSYRDWYERERGRALDPAHTVGLLLLRPQIVSNSRQHYDALIRALESEGLGVIPAISTLMDNREASLKFFVDQSRSSKRVTGNARAKNSPAREPDGQQPLVSQIISLTGFSFVGGPAMNDSTAAAAFFQQLRVPYRSLVSLDMQSTDDWELSRIGLNPIQTAMQVAIPEIDGATEPFVFGGITQRGVQPEPLQDRCRRVAKRLARWNRLQNLPRSSVRLALLIFCFPPNKGNIGTAADLDVFRSLFEILTRLKQEGYSVDLPGSADLLRERMLGGNADEFGQLANVAYRMSVEEYRRECPYVDQVEREWGRPPGSINSNGREILILGMQLGNIFIGIQPTFGYEGDPMRLLAAQSGGPHHGFAGLYTFVQKIFAADALIHVGTHGAAEFMPGKQVGLSSSCWPDRLIGELPNIYIYSVNNPSEGTIAKRRSYAELISYLTPPIENAGLYAELASTKELISAYRKAGSEQEREQLFQVIEEKARELNLSVD